MHRNEDHRVAGGTGSGVVWTACPGCGLSLPGDSSIDPRRNTSAACWALYGEAQGFEFSHLIRLGRLHQLLVDTYGAQHAGSETPPVRTGFSLIGLHLALQQGWSGIAVRDAHQDLARRFATWPTFERPATMGDVTVFDLASVESPEDYEAGLRRWAEAVWASWQEAHADVRALIRGRVNPVQSWPRPSTRATSRSGPTRDGSGREHTASTPRRS